MKKAKFMMNALKHLENEATRLVDVYGSNVNGNAFNKVWRDMDKKARENGSWATAEISKNYNNKDGSPTYVQKDMPNWQNILKNYITIAQK
jgi:NADPH-dependent curcumin reductase CurA